MWLVDRLSLLKKKINSNKTSYSFGAIDLLINYHFKNKKKGIYVDVGCQHPISNNNTYMLFKKGWSGVNIDLDKKNIDLFNLERKKDFNITAAVSSGNYKKKLFFYHSKSAINTIEKKISQYQSAKVNQVRSIFTKTLNQILKDTKIKKIDYLSIDVEGHEHEVLNGFNIKKFSPDIVTVEYLDLSMRRLEFKNNNIKKILNSNIYKYMKKNNYSFINWNHADLVFVNNKIRD
jgi:FkbM family methyltransferase